MGEARSAFAPDIWKEWQRPLKICSAVWASPEQLGHQGSSAILYGCSDSGKRPTGVLKWFSLHHAERLGPRSGFPTLGGGREWGDTPDFFHSSSHWCWVHCAIDLCPAKDSIGSIADCANGLCDLRRGLAFRRTKLLLKCSVSANFKVSRRLAAFRRTAAGTMPASISKYCVGVGFRHPVIVRKAEFIATSTCFVFLLLDHAGEKYSAVRLGCWSWAHHRGSLWDQKRRALSTHLFSLDLAKLTAQLQAKLDQSRMFCSEYTCERPPVTCDRQMNVLQGVLDICFYYAAGHEWCAVFPSKSSSWNQNLAQTNISLYWVCFACQMLLVWGFMPRWSR